MVPPAGGPIGVADTGGSTGVAGLVGVPAGQGPTSATSAAVGGRRATTSLFM
jgi:hypothetical protein